MLFVFTFTFVSMLSYRSTDWSIKIKTADWSEKWIDDRKLSEMRQRDFLHRKALKSKSDGDWKAYKVVQNRVGQQINEAKSDARQPKEYGETYQGIPTVKTNPDENFIVGSTCPSKIEIFLNNCFPHLITVVLSGET